MITTQPAHVEPCDGLMQPGRGDVWRSVCVRGCHSVATCPLQHVRLMDTLRLSRGPKAMPPAAVWTLSLRGRRLLLIVPSIALAGALLALAGSTLANKPHGLLDWILGLPFAAVMTWECFVVWQLVLGFCAWAIGPRLLSTIERDAATVSSVSTGTSRTALIIPIFDEDVDDVFARIRVMWDSFARLGTTQDIVIHVLSDTRTPAVAAAEQRYADELRDDAIPTLRYRRREVNQGRKAGNVGEFLTRAGLDFDFAIVLDADSLMTATAMRRLIRLMERHDRVALIQTVSYATGRDTLFARIQQFAVRLYAPLALRGLEFWQGGEGSYWGHNAILRVAPFRQHCTLPVLPGKPPFGGEILCHDTVEAALLVRAGWEVRLLPDTDGTWEGMPSNALDLLGREKRWCQGNLQHVGVLSLPGLRSGSRAHIILGIGGYLTAPLWWGFLLLGAVRVLFGDNTEGIGLLAYGLTEPGWPPAMLASSAAVLLVMPRVLNLWRALADARLRGSFGGARRLLVGAAIEQVFWLLFGPVLSLVNASFVLQTLHGQAVPWKAQLRGDRYIGPVQAALLHWPQLIIALILIAACAKVGGWYAAWIAPSALGLLLSPWLTSLSSRADLGRWSKRLGLFITVDDMVPARELQDLQAALAGARTTG